MISYIASLSGIIILWLLSLVGLAVCKDVLRPSGLERSVNKILFGAGLHPDSVHAAL